MLPLMTVFTQSKPNSCLQVELRKALSWMSEFFPEHIRGFSKPDDDFPFFFYGIKGRESLGTCPFVPLQWRVAEVRVKEISQGSRRKRGPLPR